MADKELFGQQHTPDTSGQYNTEDFHIRQVLGEVRTVVPVKIIAVNGGGVGAPPTVDVQPLIKQTDGQGNTEPHGIIYGIPTTRSQGGNSAIINDPLVGDVGLMTIADRDISSLKANKGEQSNPGSMRTFDMADGVYVGSMLMDSAPTRFINMTGPGIEIKDGNGNVITMAGGDVNINGVKITQGGDIEAPGNVTAGAGGGGAVGLLTHEHPTAVAGAPSPPTPGT